MKNFIEKIKNIDYQELLKQIKREKSKFGFYFVVSLIGLQVFGVIIYGILIYFNVTALGDKLATLENISIYNLDANAVAQLKGNTIYKGLDTYDVIYKDKTNLENRFNDFQSPYNTFLKNLYVPSLNIWKDPYGTGIDINLVGQQFLEKNPYIDINLLSKWGNFFRSVSDNVSATTIQNINLGEIQDQKNGYFLIPLQVKFSSPTRRSFLMLIDKLSTTSNKRNVGLINEFMYNIFDQIKVKNDAEFKKQKISDVDQYIGKVFYDWVKTNSGNNLVTDEIIIKAIQKTSKCDNNTPIDECLFKFRDKYSTISSLAYTIGDGKNPNKKESLRRFLVNLPPLLNIVNFSFMKQADTVNIGNYEYVGDIQIEIYGRSISTTEIDEISNILGESCLKNANNKEKAKYSLTFDNVRTFITDKVNLLSQNKDGIDTSVMKDISDVQTVLDVAQKEYKDLSSYKKVVKLFEIYRMLKENNLCS